MNNLKNYILEKFQITKDSKVEKASANMDMGKSSKFTKEELDEIERHIKELPSRYTIYTITNKVVMNEKNHMMRDPNKIYLHLEPDGATKRLIYMNAIIIKKHKVFNDYEVLHIKDSIITSKMDKLNTINDVFDKGVLPILRSQFK